MRDAISMHSEAISMQSEVAPKLGQHLVTEQLARLVRLEERVHRFKTVLNVMARE
jgi:hypothetical protein